MLASPHNFPHHSMPPLVPMTIAESTTTNNANRRDTPMDISETDDDDSICSSSTSASEDDDDDSVSFSEGSSDLDSSDDDDDSSSCSDWSVGEMEEELRLFHQQKQQQGSQYQSLKAPMTPNPTGSTRRTTTTADLNNSHMMRCESAPATRAGSRSIPSSLVARMSRAESTVGLPNLISPCSLKQMFQQSAIPAPLPMASPASPAVEKGHNANQDPQEYFLSLLRRHGAKGGEEPLAGLVHAKPVAATMVPSFYEEMTEDNFDAYTMSKVVAVRQDNVAALATMHEDGQILQCCNRYGESILHAACRRGAISSLKYLIDTVGVNLQVMDDYHRNPFHDACWTVQPNFELVQLLLDHCPDLLLLQDKRGCSPLQYVRKECWSLWCDFLDHQPISKLIPQSQSLLSALTMME